MTLVQENGEDAAKALVSDGLVLVEKRKEKRLQKLMEEYHKAQDAARKARVISSLILRYFSFMFPQIEICFPRVLSLPVNILCILPTSHYVGRKYHCGLVGIEETKEGRIGFSFSLHSSRLAHSLGIVSKSI